MCVYCMVGDHTFKYDPPWDYWQRHPLPWKPPSIPPFIADERVPKPVEPSKPVVPWSLERLKEYRDLLKEIRDLEEKVGCPCEPNKADYLNILQNRIAELETKQ